MPAQAPNSVTAQYISSVPAMPMSKTSAPASISPRAAAASREGGAGFARIKANHDRFCTGMLRHGSPNAIGNFLINIHTNFAADVVGLEAGEVGHFAPQSCAPAAGQTQVPSKS